MIIIPFVWNGKGMVRDHCTLSSLTMFGYWKLILIILIRNNGDITLAEVEEQIHDLFLFSTNWVPSTVDLSTLASLKSHKEKMLVVEVAS